MFPDHLSILLHTHTRTLPLSLPLSLSLSLFVSLSDPTLSASTFPTTPPPTPYLPLPKICSPRLSVRKESKHMTCTAPFSFPPLLSPCVTRPPLLRHPPAFSRDQKWAWLEGGPRQQRPPWLLAHAASHLPDHIYTD